MLGACSLALGLASDMGADTAAVSGHAPRLVVTGWRMGTRTVALLVLILACRDDAPGSELVMVDPRVSQVDPSSSRAQPREVPTEGADIQARSAQHLASTMGMSGSQPERGADSGSIWLSYRDALKELRACADGSSYTTGWRSYEGSCVDGKRFLTRNGGFGGSTRFYRGDRLVGTIGYSDVGRVPPAGDVRCEIKKRVPLCTAP